MRTPVAAKTLNSKNAETSHPKIPPEEISFC